MKNKLIISIIALIIIIALLGYLGYGYYRKLTFRIQNPIVSMDIEGYGTVKMELYPEMAPNTVTNIIKLINDGYYNGLTIYDVQELIIKLGNSGESEKSIKGEFKINDFKENTLPLEEGTIGLWRSDYTAYSSYTGDNSVIEKGYNSGFSQIFIAVGDFTEYNDYYAGFGKVTEGLDILKEISKLETTVETETNSETGEKTDKKTTTPVNQPVITSMQVETYGINYGEPLTAEAFDIQEWYNSKFSFSY